MNKAPDHEEASKALREQCEANEVQTMTAVRSLLLENAQIASQTILDLLHDEDPRIRLDASKHVLKLTGLEIERKQLSSDPENPIHVYIPAQDGGANGA